MSNDKFKTLCAFLIAFFCQLCAICFLLASIASAETFTWIAPTTNADGTPLTDLAGYELGHGAVSQQYTNFIGTGNVTTYTATIAPGRFVAVRAVDTSGNKSIWSNQIQVAAVATPSPSPTPTATIVPPTATASPSPTPDYPTILQRIDNLAQQLQRVLTGQ